jgi:hypothetical protein
VKVKAIDPTQRAGLDEITHVSRATGFPSAISGDRDRRALDS